jgi:predicted AlkP superfamily pyrophosphatase or phosphodiesterase
MHQRTRVQVPLAVVALAVATAATLASTADEPHVVVVSIDGLMASSYAVGSHAHIPTLRSLAAEGTYATGVVGVLPSVTYPSHTTLITGVPPSVHGIVDNHVFDPDGRKGGAFYWYGRDIQVPTLLGRVHEHGGKTAAIAWPVTVGMDIDYHVPEFWRRSTEPRQPRGAFLRTVSTPHLIEAVEQTNGVTIGEPQTDENRFDMSAFILARFEPRLMLVHLTDVDTAEHTFGPNSPEALEAIGRVDGYVGLLRDVVRATASADHTYFVVVSDHGFLPVTRQLNPNERFKRAGLLSVDPAGHISSWRAVFHSSGGSGFVYLQDPEDATTRAKVAAVLEELRADPGNGIDQVWTAGDIARLGGPRAAGFGLNMRAGYYTGEGHRTLLTSTLGDEESGGMRGGHGYAPSRREIQSAFIAAGPTTRGVGNLGTIRMTQIAPTLARWLGVELSPLADSPIERLVASPEHVAAR